MEQAVGGELAQYSNLHSLPDKPANLARLGTYVVYDSGYGWSDYRVLYTQRSEDDDALGLMFRVQDADNYYRFSWDRSRGYRRLVKNVNGKFTLLAEDSVPYETGRTYQAVVIAQKSRLTVFVDGAPIFDVTDLDLIEGTVGFYSWGNQGSLFDDLHVQ